MKNNPPHEDKIYLLGRWFRRGSVKTALVCAIPLKVLCVVGLFSAYALTIYTSMTGLALAAVLWVKVLRR